jgi:predicted nucleotidyltransferase
VSEIVSGFARALTALSEAGVEFVVVGVGGINFYARTPGDAFATLDVDALLAPAIENLELALSVLSQLGYEFEAGGEPFVDLDDRLVLRRILENGASLSAMHQEASEIDLLTSISGFDYSDLASDAATFKVSGAAIRVARLEKLLRSKESSGRPKDVEFLKAFRARAFEDES